MQKTQNVSPQENSKKRKLSKSEKERRELVFDGDRSVTKEALYRRKLKKEEYRWVRQGTIDTITIENVDNLQNKIFDQGGNCIQFTLKTDNETIVVERITYDKYIQRQNLRPWKSQWVRFGTSDSITVQNSGFLTETEVDKNSDIVKGKLQINGETILVEKKSTDAFKQLILQMKETYVWVQKKTAKRMSVDDPDALEDKFVNKDGEVIQGTILLNGKIIRVERITEATLQNRWKKPKLYDNGLSSLPLSQSSHMQGQSSTNGMLSRPENRPKNDLDLYLDDIDKLIEMSNVILGEINPFSMFAPDNPILTTETKDRSDVENKFETFGVRK